MTWEEVVAAGLRLPGVEVSTSYGTPALRVRGKLLARQHPDGVSLVLPVGFDEREVLMEADPETFYITDHYRGWPSMLASLERIDRASLGRLLEQAWRARATKRMVADQDQASPPATT